MTCDTRATDFVSGNCQKGEKDDMTCEVPFITITLFFNSAISFCIFGMFGQ